MDGQYPIEGTLLKKIIPSLATHGLGLLTSLSLKLLLIFARHDIKVDDGIFQDFDHFCGAR